MITARLWRAPAWTRGYAQDFRIRRTLRLPKPLMHEVVSDVARYREFVPYCLDSSVLRTDVQGLPDRAELRVGFQGLDERFESVIRCTDDRVEASAADNKMFETLLCRWDLHERAPQQCAVELTLQFRFQNKLYDFMAQNAGTLVSRKMIEAFVQRAVALHKERSGDHRR